MRRHEGTALLVLIVTLAAKAGAGTRHPVSATQSEVRVATEDAEEGFAPTAARRQERDAVEAKNGWKRLAPPAVER